MNNHDKDFPEAMFTELQELYNKLSQEIFKLDIVCDGCGKCCHFDEVDHILFASVLELQYLIRSGSFVSDKPGRCPCQIDEKCTAHGMRLLGCRLYFCNENGCENTLEEISERYHRHLKGIYNRHGVDWDYCRALDWLADRG